ncbi:AEC family transporter [Pseudoroseomonas cervicalis]|uniref:Transporter, auxin efflux carrier (AEC) family protein n=1 Tax=Pseudoroseomonas cervicalis ATCC 49957 TaxID=525371 RepID=D5RHH6_9PROT|nr:AEC family transporter [Pseudoroseomonas cervicalis]EFH13228.1 transporter, auxin efflux carrier (AEC) family protein [Pseudoroseomonas cervicalis ATCC 49957]
MNTLLTVIAPIFLLIGIGYVSARRRWISEEGLRGLTDFVFRLAMPCLLLAGATTPHPDGGGTALAFFTGCLAAYGLALLLSRLVLRMKLGEGGTFALNAAFGNTGMIGVPLVIAAYGQAGLSQLLAIIGLHSLILLPLGTVVGEIAHNARARIGAIAKSTILSVLRNPIVLAVLLGFIIHQAGLELPGVARRFLEMTGMAGPPVALFCLGASLIAFDARRDWPSALLCTALKLLLMPGLVWLVAWGIGLPRLPTAVAVLAAAMPTGANAFFLARRYAAGADRSGATVLLSTILSVATLAVLLAVL